MNLTPFGELFRKSWGIYKQKLTTLLALLAIPYVLNVIVSLSSEKAATINKTAVDGVFVFNPAMLRSTSIVVVLAIASALISLWVSAAIIKAINSPDSTPNPSELLTKSAKYILPYLLVVVLTGLAVLGGLILLIIPGIIFAVWFAFSNYTLVLEDKRSIEAMKASKALVKGRWGDVFVRFLLLMLSLIGISIVASLVLSLFPAALYSVLNGALSSFFMTPFSLIFGYLLYKDLKNHHAPKA